MLTMWTESDISDEMEGTTQGGGAKMLSEEHAHEKLGLNK
jgi:hypothetical protein